MVAQEQSHLGSSETLNQSLEPEQRDSDDLHLAVILLGTFEAEQRDSDDLHLAVILLARLACSKMDHSYASTFTCSYSPHPAATLTVALHITAGREPIRPRRQRQSVCRPRSSIFRFEHVCLGQDFERCDGLHPAAVFLHLWF